MNEEEQEEQEQEQEEQEQRRPGRPGRRRQHENCRNRKKKILAIFEQLSRMGLDVKVVSKEEEGEEEEEEEQNDEDKKKRKEYLFVRDKKVKDLLLDKSNSDNIVISNLRLHKKWFITNPQETSRLDAYYARHKNVQEENKKLFFSQEDGKKEVSEKVLDSQIHRENPQNTVPIFFEKGSKKQTNQFSKMLDSVNNPDSQGYNKYGDFGTAYNDIKRGDDDNKSNPFFHPSEWSNADAMKMYLNNTSNYVDKPLDSFPYRYTNKENMKENLSRLHKAFPNNDAPEYLRMQEAVLLKETEPSEDTLQQIQERKLKQIHGTKQRQDMLMEQVMNSRCRFFGKKDQLPKPDPNIDSDRVYMPNKLWRQHQYHAPACVASVKNIVTPMEQRADYSDVREYTGVGSILPQFVYYETPTDVNKEKQHYDKEVKREKREFMSSAKTEPDVIPNKC